MPDFLHNNNQQRVLNRSSTTPSALGLDTLTSTIVNRQSSIVTCPWLGTDHHITQQTTYIRALVILSSLNTVCLTYNCVSERVFYIQIEISHQKHDCSSIHRCCVSYDARFTASSRATTGSVFVNTGTQQGTGGSNTLTPTGRPTRPTIVSRLAVRAVNRRRAQCADRAQSWLDLLHRLATSRLGAQRSAATHALRRVKQHSTAPTTDKATADSKRSSSALLAGSVLK